MASAPEAEKAACFASAEATRRLELGVRSYRDSALGPRLGPVRCHGRAAGLGLAADFPYDPDRVAWIRSLAWMIWMVVVAWTMKL